MDELEDGEGWGGRRWGVRDGRGGELLSPRVEERWATKSTHVRFQCDVAPSLPRSHVSQPLFQFDQFRTGGTYFNKKKSSRAWPLLSDLCEDRQTGAVYAWNFECAYTVTSYMGACQDGRPRSGEWECICPDSYGYLYRAPYIHACRMSGMLRLCTPSD